MRGVIKSARNNDYNAISFNLYIRGKLPTKANRVRFYLERGNS